MTELTQQRKEPFATWLATNYPGVSPDSGRASGLKDAYEAGRSSLESAEQERDLLKENVKATNGRLGTQGLVLFNYPSKPEGCRSNIQWRNVRAEKAESENAELRGILKELDSYFDFSESIGPDGDLGKVEDPSGINRAFDRARGAIRGGTNV